MKTVIRALFLSAAIAGSTLPAWANPALGIQWKTDGPALLESKQERPMLLRFTASWCGPCRIMNGNVWPDAKVAKAVNDQFIPVELDIDRLEVQQIARKFRVAAVPTIIILDKNGTETGRANFMNPEELLKFLETSKTNPEPDEK